MDQKTLPPKSGTLSTDLWVAAAQIHNNTQSEEFSVASGTSVEEDDPFGKHRNPAESEQQNEQQYDPVNRYDPADQRSDEYDINFFDIPEEEITEHTVTSGHMDDGQMDSFDADELNLAASMDSMEQRRTTIRFDEYDELQTCLHINDYTKGEISRSWYKREDYDKMVDLARKTASKAVKREKELRDELQDVLKPDDNDTSRSGRSTGPDGKRKKPIEYRGLEAWTPEGSQKCRTMKENAIELVWNEQSRQWEDGTFDPDAISAVYIPVAQQALEIAHERALADEKMVKKLIDQDEARKQKKKNRTIIRKGRSLMTKTAKNTGKMLGQGAEKVLKETGKGAVKIGKRGVKAVVATATLDQKMMKEAVKIRVHGKKKRECKHEKEIAPSKASHQRDVEEMEESLARSEESDPLYVPSGLHDRRQTMQKPVMGTPTDINASSDHGSDLSSVTDTKGGRSNQRDFSSKSDGTSNTNEKKKKSKLKLLGIVPIPGTQKMYSEDRRKQREEKRIAKQNRRPSWEAGMATGKY